MIHHCSKLLLVRIIALGTEAEEELLAVAPAYSLQRQEFTNVCKNNIIMISDQHC